MAQLTLFDSEDRPAQARRLAGKLHGLAERNVFFGTSSWKYEGWLGDIYSKDRYVERGKFSQKKFESECLREYAETFPVVGGDFSFYQFPSPSYWKRLFDETPSTLKFGLKVPEEITVPRWPGHARYGTRAGTANQGFLDNRLFHEQFTWPLERYRDRVAALIFEFGTFAKSIFSRPADFLRDSIRSWAPSLAIFATRLRSATRSTWGRITSQCFSRTTRRTFSTRGRACRNCSTRSTCRAPARPISRSFARFSRRGALRASRQGVRALQADPGAKPRGARGDAKNRRAGLEDPPARLRLREQPARRQRAGDDRGSGGRLGRLTLTARPPPFKQQ